jgi:lysophospholipase L1-like esterase
MEVSGGVNTEVTFTLSDLMEQTQFKINYDQQTSAAFACEIYVNETLVGTDSIATNTVKKQLTGSLYNLVDNGSNGATIKVKVTSGTAIISGATYYADNTDLTLNNYSESGRKTKNIKESVVSQIMSENSVVFWCLGANDSEADKTTALQVLDWVKQYAATNGTFIVFCDFMWNTAKTNHIKVKYKSLVESMPNQAVYIDLPSQLRYGGSTSDTTYLTTTLGAWVDSAHPNKKGHAFIFNAIKKALFK